MRRRVNLNRTHTFAGPAAASFVGNQNSDFADGKIRDDAPPAQLYDLEADVNQTKNLYNEYPEVVQEMKARLETYKPAEPEPATPKREPRKKKRQQ